MSPSIRAFETARARDRHWPWLLIAGLVLLLIGAILRDVGLPGEHSVNRPSESASIREPAAAKGPGLATHVSTLSAKALFRRALAGSESAWCMLHAKAADFPEVERAELKGKLAHVLATAVHPKAIYRGGSDAIRLAALLPDPRLSESLLTLLSHWEGVVMKLPLTEQRDDLLVLEAIQEGVRAAGTHAQRARLAAWLAAVQRTESMNEADVEADARTEMRER